MGPGHVENVAKEGLLDARTYVRVRTGRVRVCFSAVRSIDDVGWYSLFLAVCNVCVDPDTFLGTARTGLQQCISIICAGLTCTHARGAGCTACL